MKKNKQRLEDTTGYNELTSKVKDVSNKAYRVDSPSQKTIDLIERAEELINNEESYPDDSILHNDTVGAYLYEVGLILEIINPELEIDINYLRELRIAFGKWEVFYKEYLKD